MAGATDKVREKGDEAASDAQETANEAQDTAESAGTDAAGTATDAAAKTNGGVKGAAKEILLDPITEQVRDAVQQAAKEILAPALQAASKQAFTYAAKQGPDLLKQAVPAVLDKAGVDTPQDLVKKGVGTVGDAMSDAGGVGGMIGKVMSKVGGKGGKGGGNATGYGVKRRMPIQQDIFVSLPLDLTYTAWTEYKRWPEFMFRANQVDPQVEDEEGGNARLKVTEKMWGFTRPFTAEVVEQHPDEYIRWRSVDGTKHVGVISFHELGPRLTLISVNIDHGPSGPIEKIARGARFDKRAIRADLHRFKGWIEHRDPEDLENIEGWRGTIESGEIVQTHEDALAEQQEEQSGDGQETEGQESAGEERDTSRDEADDTEADEQPVAEEADEPEEEPEEEEQPEAEEEEQPEAEEEEQPEAEEPAEAEDSPNGEYDWDAISDMGRNELRALIREEDLGVRMAKKGTATVRTEVAEALEIELPDEEA
jgi:uncharacterized membrane protein